MVMSGQKKKKTRRYGPNGWQERISLDVRRAIVSGAYVPGSRLPSRIEFERCYDAAPNTIQGAFSKLAADGFIHTARRAGTFVSAYPPCFNNYALIMTGRENSERHSEVRFRRVLSRLAARRCGNVRFTEYVDLEGRTDDTDYDRLLTDFRQYRFAGILFSSPPWKLKETSFFAELLSRPKVPRIAFMGGTAFPKIPRIENDTAAFIPRVMAYFQKAGRRRLAVLTVLTSEAANQRIYHEELLYKSAADHGLKLHPSYMQVTHSRLAPRARALAQLMMQGPFDIRPDAFLILDDSLVEAASLGIADAGRHPPTDLTVAAYCDFPEIPPSAVPVTCFGMDVGVFLDTALDLLERQRQGQSVPFQTTISLRFARPDEKVSKPSMMRSCFRRLTDSKSPKKGEEKR